MPSTQSTAVQGLAVTVDYALDGLVDSNIDGQGQGGALASSSTDGGTGGGSTDGGGLLAAAISGEGGVASVTGAKLLKTEDCPDEASSLPDTGGSNLGLLVAGGASISSARCLVRAPSQPSRLGTVVTLARTVRCGNSPIRWIT